MLWPVRRGVRERAGAVVAAVGRKGDRPARAQLHQGLQRIIHGRCLPGRGPRWPRWSPCDASCSLLVRYVMNMRPPGCAKPRSSTFSTRKPEADLGADRIQVGIEGLFGDRKVGQPHRHDAAAAPDKQRERLLQRNDFQRAGVGHGVVGQQRLDGRIDQHLQLRQLRMQPVLHGDADTGSETPADRWRPVPPRA